MWHYKDFKIFIVLLNNYLLRSTILEATTVNKTKFLAVSSLTDMIINHLG